MHTDKERLKAKRVLVVDDDTELCNLIERLVSTSALPIELRFASTAQEAELWISNDEFFDLVLADFLLADSQNGYALRRVCEKFMPETAFAMMSSMPLQLPELDRQSFLQKPFSKGEWQEFMQARLAA